ncbi:amidase [Acetobacter sp. TBRC 12305]|uniref:Amidase n=1 Tax=Acetobacter garciniae TaxID=2817435 RepID=A0A939HPT8_9PROT|nr:amidase [Acetobacter garciniae]MBO1325111.1 amidase [Acetobacter garciniae]MBX0344918.1 amidase [Acetobacter garciniae]
MSEDRLRHAAALIQRIETSEPVLRAFTAYDPVRIRAEALGAPQGPLSGLSVGVKDIIDTADYATGHGSPIYDGWHPRSDASCVTLLRAAGAVCVGKTVTTEFAFFRAGATVNPYDHARTPGGSSSGSATAVAAGMIDIGLASQTAASLTRPASYCGIVGFKPSYGRYASAGIKSLAPSFDTLGTMTRDVATAALADGVLKGPVAAPTPLVAQAPKRIGLCRTPHWAEAGPATQAALEQAAGLFGAQVEVAEIDLSAFADAADLHITIMSYEAVQALAWEYTHRRDMLSPQISALLEAGRGISYATYRTALARAQDLRARMAELTPPGTVLLAPAAPDVAPLLSEGTGSPLFSRLWTLLRLPTITLPGLVSATGLPVGVQLLGPFGEDEALLAHAAWAETVLPARPVPPAVSLG